MYKFINRFKYLLIPFLVVIIISIIVNCIPNIFIQLCGNYLPIIIIILINLMRDNYGESKNVIFLTLRGIIIGLFIGLSWTIGLFITGIYSEASNPIAIDILKKQGVEISYNEYLLGLIGIYIGRIFSYGIIGCVIGFIYSILRNIFS
jgi:hypothetical protein